MQHHTWWAVGGGGWASASVMIQGDEDAVVLGATPKVWRARGAVSARPRPDGAWRAKGSKRTGLAPSAAPDELAATGGRLLQGVARSRRGDGSGLLRARPPVHRPRPTALNKSEPMLQKRFNMGGGPRPAAAWPQRRCLYSPPLFSTRLLECC